MSKFSTRIKNLRQEKGLTQEALANQINDMFDVNINKGMLSKWETGKEEASMANMRLLVQYFGCTLDYLLGLSDEDRRSSINDSDRKLSIKEEKDVARTMVKLKDQLRNQQGLMFDGEPMDEETIELLLEELERQERIVKLANRKYTPNKYKKE